MKLIVLFLCIALTASGQNGLLHPLPPGAVRIRDSFWSPRLRLWERTTVNDVFDKFEKTGAFRNFDSVAQGKKNTGVHDGPPWYDGLVYETIRGAADLMARQPDPALERRIDGYIDRILAAQAADPDGYINTYTTLTRPDKRWGTHGGDDKWQHDVYNSGMLIEAAVHYYRATGKTKLLRGAVRLANYMCSQMGPAPRSVIIPGHAGPEEALVKLYSLCKEQPALGVGDPSKYLQLAQFWVEARGHHNDSYNQDDVPVFRQPEIEGHAVRATLLATGVAAIALQTGDSAYMHTAYRYWDNMIGKKLFITGGEGAIADGERFGPDYFLPESAYLETCAAIGSGFFSEKMNRLTADGRYVDELERVLYNNFLSGIALDGVHYFYENPLADSGHVRWSWHSCPCCPPMILKLAGALPGYIYGSDSGGVYVNLFIGSSVAFDSVRMRLATGYPWSGDVRLTFQAAPLRSFALRVRIPGWAQGRENPFGLYSSSVSGRVRLSVNGHDAPYRLVNGYAVLRRVWRAGDVVALSLPMQPRLVTASDSVTAVRGKVAIASGPIVYGVETVDNVLPFHIDTTKRLVLTYRPDLLGGVNVIRDGSLTAVPFFTLGNRRPGARYTVWISRD